jgi:GDP-mannose transporter
MNCNFLSLPGFNVPFYLSMVGALNKLPVAASGMLFFGDVVTFGSVLAIGLGFFAGIVYAVAKNNQKKTDSRTQADSIIPFTNRKG